MSKKIYALLLATLVLLSGCGARHTVETTAQTEPEPTQVEIPFVPQQQCLKYEGVQLRVLSPYWDNEPTAQVMMQAAEVFEKQTGAQIQFLWAADPASGVEGYDLFQTGIENLKDELLSKTLDLSAMAQVANYDAQSFPALRRQVMAQCGYLAGLAQVPEITGVYYLTDAFDAAGLTTPDSWEEFLNVSQKLREAGFEALALNQEAEALATYFHLERSFGAERLFAESADKLKFASDDQVLEVVQQILDYVAQKTVLLEAFPGGQNKLGLSNATMTLGSNALCAQVETAAQATLNWGAFPWPGAQTGDGCLIRSDVVCVHRDSANPQAAFDFALLLCTGEFDQLRADVTGGIAADPANETTIAGAASLLQSVQMGRCQMDDAVPTEIFSKLWEGKYKTAAKFAAAWDQAR